MLFQNENATVTAKGIEEEDEDDEGDEEEGVSEKIEVKVHTIRHQFLLVHPVLYASTATTDSELICYL